MKAPAIIASIMAISMLSRAEPESGAGLVRQLLDPKLKHAALGELIRRNEYHVSKKTPESKVNHVVVCPQPHGDPLYAVFRHEGYEARYGGGPGKAIGHVILFTADGDYVPFCRNANSIQGVFKDANADGVVENIEAGRVGGCCPVSFGATILRVLPIVTNPVPLLCVAYNPQDRKTGQWSWRVVDANDDGVLEIQLGPVLRIHGDPGMNLHDDGRNKTIDPVVTYTWSMEEKAYVGPDGGNDEAFKRICTTNQTPELKEFSRRKKKEIAEPEN